MLSVLLLGMNVGTASPSFVCSLENLSGTDKTHLRVYRNEIFARHGRPFKSKDLNQIFYESGWYTEDSSYTDARLTAEDRSCLNIIQGLEKNTRNVLKPDLDGDGIGEKIYFDGKTLRINSASITVNQDVSGFAYNVSSEQFKSWMTVEDFQYSDSVRELLVVTNPGEEDETQFQIFRYSNNTITPLMKKPEWVPHQHFKRSNGKLIHKSTNCGTTTTSAFVYYKNAIVRRDSTKGTFNPNACAACPYVYLNDQEMQFVDEILKNQSSEDLYGPDEIALGVRGEGETVRVKIVEVKPETSYIDQLSFVVETKDGDFWVEQPLECSDNRQHFCTEDRTYSELHYGSELNLSFEVPVDGRVILRAVGYYIPFSE